MPKESGRPDPNREIESTEIGIEARGLIDNFEESIQHSKGLPNRHEVDWEALLGGTLKITRLGFRRKPLQQVLISPDQIVFVEYKRLSERRLVNTVSALEKVEKFMEKIAPLRPAPEDFPWQPELRKDTDEEDPPISD